MKSAELFKNVPSTVGQLVGDVRTGRIGLPDLQRPFVWKDNKVRDLFDSMLKGYPIGYVMLWESPADYEDKKSQIGLQEKTFTEPKSLVIDGQQRLTSLLAAMYGIPVKDKNYETREIKISFNPMTCEFEVWSQAFEKDPNWISKISDVFISHEDNLFPHFRKDFIRTLNESRAKKGLDPLTDDDEIRIEENLNRLLSLDKYPLPSLEITYNADEEAVADIFVRVNSGGQKLNENNFIQTLLSVYDLDTANKMEAFAEDSRTPPKGKSPSAFNHIIDVECSHLIKIAVGLGFRRARLKYAYMLLRGKNLETREFSDELRAANLSRFKDALEKAIDLNNWHGFLNCIGNAGYLSKTQIASSNAVVYSYVLYLIGKYDFKLTTLALDKLIAKWFFATAIRFFYSGSPESKVEKQFADLRSVQTGDQYIAYLEEAISTIFTDDYFNIVLPGEFVTTSTNSPSWNGFTASLNVLGTPMLFSNAPLAKFFLPGVSGTKNAIDKHHIFPKNYLAKIGFDDDRDRNQIANFTFIDYENNIEISDKSPAEYIPPYRERMGAENFRKACAAHALPENFETMDYNDFLQARRRLMSQIVKQAFEHLKEL